MTDYLTVASRVETLAFSSDEILVFDGATLHLLAGSSAEIWHAVNGQRSREEIGRLLAERHEDADVADQVHAFVDSLTGRGLLAFNREPGSRELAVDDDVAWTVDEGRVVVLNLLTGERRTLSDSASAVWELVVAGRSRDETLVELAGAFTDLPEGFAEQVDALLQQLVDEGLLARVADG